MPEVSITVQMRVEVEDDIDPLALEQAISAEGRRGARELLAHVVQVIDGRTAGQGRQRLEPRWIATTFARIRIQRYRIGTDTGSTHPTDIALGIDRAEAPPALRETICDLALKLPYRQTAGVVSRICGEHVSHQSAWRVLHDEGARVRNEEGELVGRIFELGEAPPDTDAHELVVVEADGTFLRAQREELKSFEVKTGVFYTGKARAGGRKHRRRKLLNKGCYATTADADNFGKGLATRGFHWVGLHRAAHVLAAHDGLDEYGKTFHDWFPHAVHQIDHFHVAERLWQAVGGDRGRFRRLRKAAFADPRRCARQIRRGAYGVKVDLAADLAGYLEHVAADLHGIRKLPAHLRRDGMDITGSGVVEKHQDLLVGRRMKRRGMRWTRRGADRLLALQALAFSGRWPSNWGVVGG